MCSTFTTDLKLALQDTSRTRNDPLIPEKWARIDAFAARLTTRFVIDWRHRNVQAIDEALLEENLKDAMSRNLLLPAAANQIIYGALPLWNLGNDHGAEPRPNPYNDWVAWRSKLGEVAETADLPEDKRMLLRQAVEVMDRTAQGPESIIWLV